jgi:site-specific DNA-methyltransferase (adenine-specific)
MTLRLGRWQDVLGDVGECDAVITDPPYSPRQHLGFKSGNDYAEHTKTERKKNSARRAARGDAPLSEMRYGSMPYAPIDGDIARDSVEKWITWGPSWLFIFGDHISFRQWEDAAIAVDWYTFAPVVWLRGRMPRFQGDGPSSDCEYALAARPKRTTKCGSLPGHYTHSWLRLGSADDRILTGQKPLGLMRRIVKDYTQPEQLIVEPHAGSGTTLLAAAMEGRRAIGAEMDPKTYALAVKRLSKGYTERLFRDGIQGTQEPLL